MKAIAPQVVFGLLVGYALGFATPTLIRSAVENENLPTGSPRDQTAPVPTRLDDLPDHVPRRDSQKTFKLLPTYKDDDRHAMLREHPPGDAMNAHGAVLAGGGCTP